MKKPMSNQTPIQKKIEELVNEITCNGWFEDEIKGESIKQGMLALAQYIKDEVVPEEVLEWSKYGASDYVKGMNNCRSKVVDNFKELGI